MASRRPASTRQAGIRGEIVGPVGLVLADLGFVEAASHATAGSTSSSDANALFDRAATALRDDVIGIRVAERVPIGGLGAIDYALVSSASVREGLLRVAEHYNVVTDRIRLELREEPAPVLRFVRRPEFTISRHWLDFSMGMFARRLRECVGPEFALERVSFMAPAPHARARHREFFRAPVSYGAAVDGLHLARRWLDAPLRTAAASLAAVLDARLALTQQDQSAEDAFLRRLRAAMLGSMESGEATLATIARQMGTTPRTLQRELERRGASHRELYDELRRERALELLAEGRCPLPEIATRVGFAEPTSFFRAFRRWTGTSPRAAKKDILKAKPTPRS